MYVFRSRQIQIGKPKFNQKLSIHLITEIIMQVLLEKKKVYIKDSAYFFRLERHKKECT